MHYDVLDMPNRNWQTRGPVRYPYSVSVTPKTILSEETDEETGDTVIRRTPAPTYQPDSHYVMFRADNEEVWRIYAGPFDLGTAAEIASALQAYSK